MNVLKALSITRDPSSDYDAWVAAVLVLYANLSQGKVVYRCHATHQEIYFSLTDDEKDYLRCRMIYDGKDPDEEGLTDYFGD